MIKKRPRRSAAVVILFNQNGTEFLVGHESQWVTEIPELDSKDRKEIWQMFSRKVANPKDATHNVAHNVANQGSHCDPDEVAYYKTQIHEFLKSRVMDKVKPVAASLPPKITFGDIKYKKRNGVLYSFTIPQYLPSGSVPNFPAGGLKKGVNTNIKAAGVREFYEETGIDLSKEPFDLNKLKDLEAVSSGYHIYTYETNDAEYKEAYSNITAKNLNPCSELHGLEFISTRARIAPHARKQYRVLRSKTLKKSHISKQRWRSTLRKRSNGH